jgi:hypothetical protein
LKPCSTRWQPQADKCCWSAPCAAGHNHARSHASPSIHCPAGTLPPAWSRLAALRDLRLADCRLSGPLPPAWGVLTKLKVCYLYNNTLSGPLPSAWSGMVALEDLALYNSNLTGRPLQQAGRDPAMILAC